MNVSTHGRIVIAVMVLVIAAGTAFANFAGTNVFIPSLGHGPGASQSQWNACIWVHNPNTAPVNVTFRLLLRDQPNPSPQVYSDTIPAGDTRRYDDALATLFGVTTKTFGAVRVTTPAGQAVIVNARSYSTPPGGDQMDTAGQFYAAIPASFAIGPQQKTELLGVYQTTPQAGSEFRYNYGFVETTGNSVTVRVTALDENGTSIGAKSYTLGGFEARQYNITDLLPSVNATNVRLEVAVTLGPGQVVAFGSGIANRSNDPSTFEMSFRDELLAENSSGGGLSAVAHDGTLTGNGTTATPLGIANAGVGATQLGGGAVSKGKLSATGGTNGQVLGTDGTSLKWQNDAGLTLPYSGSASTANPAFSITNAGTGHGVYGSTSSVTRAGVRGSNTLGPGVTGRSDASSGVEGGSTVSYGVGVWGWNYSGGYGGQFDGKVKITGNLSVTGTKSFAIDHPLDPENRELWHAAVESSEVLDIYSGNVVTDGEGAAAVQLPDWFQALNTDFRYQLTCIGRFAQAIVEREIENNRFTIRTNLASVKVSWQVTAKRNDAMMRAHPFVAERDKPEAERGSYLSPVEHGQPKEKGVEWALHPEMMRQIEAERQEATAR